MIQVGDRVEFLRGGLQYSQGMRSATVIEIISYRDAIKRDAAKRGEPWPLVADRQAESIVRYGEMPYAWLAVDPEPKTGVPEGIEIAGLWGEFSIVGRVVLAD
jgi:hypothetical protein